MTITHDDPAMITQAVHGYASDGLMQALVPCPDELMNLADTEDKLAFARQYYNDSAANVNRLRKHTDLPICVGFGVKTAEQARQIAKDADGVVVGSALVSAVEKSLTNAGKATPDTAKAVHTLVAEIAQGVRS
jgi:imidazole glycerol phosphate synthase subunit HisF